MLLNGGVFSLTSRSSASLLKAGGLLASTAAGACHDRGDMGAANRPTRAMRPSTTTVLISTLRFIDLTHTPLAAQPDAGAPPPPLVLSSATDAPGQTPHTSQPSLLPGRVGPANSPLQDWGRRPRAGEMGFWKQSVGRPDCRVKLSHRSRRLTGQVNIFLKLTSPCPPSEFSPNPPKEGVNWVPLDSPCMLAPTGTNYLRWKC